MTMSLPPLNLPRTLSVMPTFQCTAACTSCGTLSSPRVTTKLPRAVVLDSIQEASRCGFGLVVFTGGEATLEMDTLLQAIVTARRCDLLTRLVTNAHWATNQDAADDMIGRLLASGLNEINYSTGDQHARFVPVENVLRATRAAVAREMVPSIMVETVAERVITKDVVENHPLFTAIIADFPGRLINVHESPWMPLKHQRVARYADGLAVDGGNLASCTGCDSVLQTYTVEADGRIGACCGLGMRLIPELQVGVVGVDTLSDAISVAEDDVLKRWIRVDGPERILAWAAEHDSTIAWEGMYAHRCQACLRLYKDETVRSVIRAHWKEKLADIVYSEWLLYRFEPSSAVETDPSADEGAK
jgi:hypothetical protein